MPAPLRPISDALLATILDGQGHDPCSGVDISFDVELRPAAGSVPRQHATIFRPASDATGVALVAFHGGGFSGGDPNGCGALGKMLALSLGITTFSVSYRLGTAENPTGPGILEDAAHALRWIHAHASDLAVDPARIGVHGESAGVLLAGHLAVRSPLVGTADLPAPAAFYAFWGPLDFVARWYDNGENNGAERNIIGTGGFLAHPAAYHQLGVLTHAQGSHLPPALFVYGRTDPVVHARQAALGAAAWQATGAHAESLILPHIGHCIQIDNRHFRQQFLEKAATFAAWRHAG